MRMMFTPGNERPCVPYKNWNTFKAAVEGIFATHKVEAIPFIDQQRGLPCEEWFLEAVRVSNGVDLSRVRISGHFNEDGRCTTLSGDIADAISSFDDYDLISWTKGFEPFISMLSLKKDKRATCLGNIQINSEHNSVEHQITIVGGDRIYSYTFRDPRFVIKKVTGRIPLEESIDTAYLLSIHDRYDTFPTSIEISAIGKDYLFGRSSAFDVSLFFRPFEFTEKRIVHEGNTWYLCFTAEAQLDYLFVQIYYRGPDPALERELFEQMVNDMIDAFAPFFLEIDYEYLFIPESLAETPEGFDFMVYGEEPGEYRVGSNLPIMRTTFERDVTNSLSAACYCLKDEESTLLNGETIPSWAAGGEIVLMFAYYGTNYIIPTGRVSLGYISGVFSGDISNVHRGRVSIFPGDLLRVVTSPHDCSLSYQWVRAFLDRFKYEDEYEWEEITSPDANSMEYRIKTKDIDYILGCRISSNDENWRPIQGDIFFAKKTNPVIQSFLRVSLSTDTPKIGDTIAVNTTPDFVDCNFKFFRKTPDESEWTLVKSGRRSRSSPSLNSIDYTAQAEDTGTIIKATVEPYGYYRQEKEKSVSTRIPVSNSLESIQFQRNSYAVYDECVCLIMPNNALVRVIWYRSKDATTWIKIGEEKETIAIAKRIVSEDDYGCFLKAVAHEVAPGHEEVIREASIPMRVGEEEDG